MATYYNENEPYAAQWLRNLIAAGHIAPGDVDERSIVDVSPDDVRGYTQCHWFAGIAGWSYALRLAGWPDDRPVWTGSCPCQPFSVAGRQRGSADERHLWPAWFRLIRECRPSAVFGEQVAGAPGYAWLDHICADLEGADYAAAAANLPACSVGAPHIRARLWWVAHTGEGGRPLERAPRLHAHGQSGHDVARCSAPDPAIARARWADLEWLACSDGKHRPTEPGLFPLAHGIASRVGKLRAYGNAIVPQVAAEFIKCCMDLRP